VENMVGGRCDSLVSRDLKPMAALSGGSRGGAR